MVYSKHNKKCDGCARDSYADDWSMWPPDDYGRTPIRGDIAGVVHDVLHTQNVSPARAATLIVDQLIKLKIIPDEKAESDARTNAAFQTVTEITQLKAKRTGAVADELLTIYPWAKHLDEHEQALFIHDLVAAAEAGDVELVVARWKNTADINADHVLRTLLSKPVKSPYAHRLT